MNVQNVSTMKTYTVETFWTFIYATLNRDIIQRSNEPLLCTGRSILMILERNLVCNDKNNIIVNMHVLA